MKGLQVFTLLVGLGLDKRNFLKLNIVLLSLHSSCCMCQALYVQGAVCARCCMCKVLYVQVCLTRVLLISTIKCNLIVGGWVTQCVNVIWVGWVMRVMVRELSFITVICLIQIPHLRQ